MKPILFNTEMVRAILDGHKTATRRAIKPQPKGQLVQEPNGSCWPGYFAEVGTPRVVAPPYFPGDILYVRETWAQRKCADCQDDECGPDIMRKWRLVPCYDGIFLYKVTDFINRPIKWRSPIHMPKEAARMFLRVTDVMVERLQDITEKQALLEGVPDDGDYPLENPVYCPTCKGEGLIGAIHPVSLGYMEVDCPYCDTPRKRFSNLWNSITKPADRDRYNWDANPWVWVIEFERISREKALKGGAE